MGGRNLGTIAGVAILAITASLIGGALPASADASAIVSSADCLENVLPANDDGSSSQVLLPFGVNFFGASHESLWVNNNGNVTFDEPLPTYTPFGLLDTDRKIIAPFFADVDTRADGSDPVTYGWGETTYEGHRALCVNWLNVGYYGAHDDLLNSFQLLIVERDDSPNPGDFDIVFNYGAIQWETGDASGGVGGLGGSSAVVGFSAGTGLPNSAFELQGSAVNGAFLDGGPRSLASSSTDSVVTGRHVFRVRGGGAPLTQYVALGDSYQSGEGADWYLPGTDVPGNVCHRSAVAYPRLLVDNGVVDLNLDFGACSGAVIDDLPVLNQDLIAQLDRLNSSTKLVTIGIGGNDLGFPAIVSGCVTQSLNLFDRSTCEPDFGDQVEAGLDTIGPRLETAYKEIRSRAPFARIVVLGYPKFFVEGGANNGLSDDYCAGIRISDQRWINKSIREVNRVIRNAVRPIGLQYVSVYSAPEGNELCAPTSTPFMNGVDLVNQEHSFHPNQFGHSLLAETVASALASPGPGVVFNVRPGESITSSFQVSSGNLDVTTQWPGSDVVLTLTSPSGRVITRNALGADVEHELGPTFESYHVASAEVGTWTATLFGADVAPGGEETRLDVWQEPVENIDPVARMTWSQSSDRLSVSAGSSSDEDGEIIEYLWDFGDGTTATGVSTVHEFTQPGTYLVTLAVRDEDGGESFASSSEITVTDGYPFVGFLDPVENLPSLNVVKAGSSVPLKFELGGDQGLDILDGGGVSSRTVDCVTGAPTSVIDEAVAPGASGLTYDVETGVYTWVWKTSKPWASTCRVVELRLDDGSVHSAQFKLR